MTRRCVVEGPENNCWPYSEVLQVLEESLFGSSMEAAKLERYYTGMDHSVELYLPCWVR